MTKPNLTIAILGASGLIGEAVASGLMRQGFRILPIARRFSDAQKCAFREIAIECALVDDPEALTKVLALNRIDVVVNCVGILQDGPRGNTDAVHVRFIERLVKQLGAYEPEALLIHLSIPGRDESDATEFSKTKREAERVISASAVPFVILRPGFTIAPSAYGGSAAMRALAMLPFDLAPEDAGQPFHTVYVADIARSVAFVAESWSQGKHNWNVVWNVMARQPTSFGDVMDAFRSHLGGPKSLMALPSWATTFAARASDLVAHLGWTPPLRSTALQEMRRGVAGDPGPWIEATGIEPLSLQSSLQRTPASVQEKWFARLYFMKALILASLVIFWTVSGLIAETVAFVPAMDILVSHGFLPGLAAAVTTVSSCCDFAVGVTIAIRRTCRIGLVTGIGLSLFYMFSALVITPELWVEPLGALVKTGPAIVLMLVALAISDDR